MHKVRKFMHGPLDSYWFVVKQILRYLKRLVSTGLLITKAMDFILVLKKSSHLNQNKIINNTLIS